MNSSAWAQKGKFHWHNVQNAILSQNLDPVLRRTNGRCIYIKHETPSVPCLWSTVFSSWLHWGFAIYYLQLPHCYTFPQSLQVPSLTPFNPSCNYMPVASAPTEGAPQSSSSPSHHNGVQMTGIRLKLLFPLKESF